MTNGLSIETIEDAIITGLAPLKIGYEKEENDPAIYATVREIKSYQGELENEDELNAIIKIFPSIFVVYGGSRYEDHGSRKVEFMKYVLFVCDKSLRLETEARRGGSNNPGTYAMLKGVQDLLYGKRLSLDIFPFSLNSVSNVWAGKGVSVYGAEYETAQALLYPSDLT